MSTIFLEGYGWFQVDWSTVQHPTPDPGADSWLIELNTVWWMTEDQSLYLEVNRHALWHRTPGGILSEVLEQWIYDNVPYDPNDYYDYADYED